MSDSHGKVHHLKKLVKEGVEGDLFIHAGDFTEYNKRVHFEEFIELMSELKFKHKVVIPGNHEILLDGSFTRKDRE